MKRAEYNNGQSITLACGCDGCSPSMVNGVLVHEAGCPDAWRDYQVACFECGSNFYPAHRPLRGCRCVCEDCANPTVYDMDDDDNA